MKRALISTALAAVLCPAVFAQTEESPAGARQSYDAAFFERFAPRTALDMVSEVPGFQIRIDRSEERGLGQARDNVLINGRRISGKSNDVLSALQRIPAEAVERIELRDGATLAIPGLSGQVVNVVADLTDFSVLIMTSSGSSGFQTGGRVSKSLAKIRPV